MFDANLISLSSIFFFVFPGYRCLRAIGFLSGLAAGAGCIFWLQTQQITLIGSPADSGKNTPHFKRLIISGY